MSHPRRLDARRQRSRSVSAIFVGSRLFKRKLRRKLAIVTFVPANNDFDDGAVDEVVGDIFDLVDIAVDHETVARSRRHDNVESRFFFPFVRQTFLSVCEDESFGRVLGESLHVLAGHVENLLHAAREPDIETFEPFRLNAHLLQRVDDLFRILQTIEQRFASLFLTVELIAVEAYKLCAGLRQHDFPLET